MDSRSQQLSLVLALLAATGFLVPTGAVAFLPGEPTDQLGERVELQPGQSGYTYLEDGELVLDISSSNPNIEAEGVNPDSVSTFEDVFVIHYDGDQYADVWLTQPGDSVTFTVDGDPIETPENNVTLGPNESVAVDMTVDATDPRELERLDEFTVHSRVGQPTETPAASMGVQTLSASVAVTTPEPGERIVRIEDAAAGDSIEADLDALVLEETEGETLALDTMTVDHEASGDSEFELATLAVSENDTVDDAFPDATGTRALGAVAVEAIEDDPVERLRFDLRASADYLAARNASAQNLTVYQFDGESWEPLDVGRSDADPGSTFTVDVQQSSILAVGAPTAIFDVTTVRASESAVEAGDQVSITGTVTNRGTANDTTTVSLTVDNETVDQQPLTLTPNETGTVTFSHQFQEPGNHTVAIGDAPGVRVAVDAETDVTATGETTETPPPEPTIQPTTQSPEPTDEPTSRSPIEEPASIDLDRILGLGLVTTLALLTVLLVRRRPLG